MTNLEYRKSIADVIYLCACAVNGCAPEQTRLNDINLDNLFKASQKHMLTAMIGQFLQKQGISSAKLKNAIALAQRKTVILNNDLTNVTTALEKTGIWYMPLKGAVLRSFYPQFAMREMADIDILFDASRSADVKNIMEGLGFQAKSYGYSNDDDYTKSPVSNFEMHKALFGDQHDKKLFEYYKNVKFRLVKDEGNDYGYHFAPEDFYIFMIAHEYKHYNSSGTGLRSLLDTYVFLRTFNLDMDYVTAEMGQLGIAEYEQQNRSLALDLFSGKKLTSGEREMLDYIIDSGMFGTMEHGIKNRLQKSGSGKLYYLRRRIFGPGKNDVDREHFKRRYATFFNHPILLPFLPFYRLFKALKTSPKRICSEADALRKAGKATRFPKQEKRSNP